MYIVAIAWIYVTLMVSIMQPTVFRGVVTFLGVGLGPLALLLWLVGTPARRRRQAADDAGTEGAVDSGATAAAADEAVAPARTSDESPAAARAAAGPTAAGAAAPEGGEPHASQSTEAIRPVSPSRR